VIPECVLCEPAWLEEWLVDQGVAGLDWRRLVPDAVIDVVQAMHRAGRTDEEIAAHFAAAIQLHSRAQADAMLTARERRQLGGGWTPTPGAMESVRDAINRRARRAAARAAGGSR
jgi:hypothetical protein